ncbi:MULTISPECIES: HTH domain-containing protein [Glutamicibacter]|uniref:HTH domain-containing protein n=1 Tax=Glutamicibacter TaxID=1742989 RepID=UPI00167F405E|nr:HTH domain-containing protein [Glutamicibacter nicotianae]
MNAEPEFITPAQLAEKLNISKTTVLTKIRNGDWECTKLSDRIYRFSPEQVEIIKAGDNRRHLKSNKTRLRAALKAIG